MLEETITTPSESTEKNPPADQLGSGEAGEIQPDNLENPGQVRDIPTSSPCTEVSIKTYIENTLQALGIHESGANVSFLPLHLLCWKASQTSQPM